MTQPATLGEVVAGMEALFPARGADDGDPIGLVVGVDSAPVRRVLFAVDPVQAVVDEALASASDLLITHHPLLFRAVHSVAASTPKGRAVHDLISGGVGLLVAHTNADSAAGGVSESLGLALGLQEMVPLRSAPAEPLDTVVAFVPNAQAEGLIDALAGAGAGSLGNYDRCAFTSTGVGTFRPGAGAHPAIGNLGVVETVSETRVEMVLPRRCRAAVIAALRSSHPYEEPAFDILEMAELPDRPSTGTGRVGVLAQPITLRRFADVVAAALPPTAVGARVSGDLDALVHTVGVVGGAGDFMLDEARRAGVDVFVTSDLRHHPASELREHDDAPALVDVPHWAAEWTWLPPAAAALTAELARHGKSVGCAVSLICTDPWNHRAASPAASRTPDGPSIEQEESP